jgi:hypothetical protein
MSYIFDNMTLDPSDYNEIAESIQLPASGMFEPVPFSGYCDETAQDCARRYRTGLRDLHKLAVEIRTEIARENQYYKPTAKLTIGDIYSIDRKIREASRKARERLGKETAARIKANREVKRVRIVLARQDRDLQESKQMEEAARCAQAASEAASRREIAEWIREREQRAAWRRERILLLQSQMQEYTHTSLACPKAEIIESIIRLEDGTEVLGVVAMCLDGGLTSDNIPGNDAAARKAALRSLNQLCTCGSKWHVDKESNHE